MGMSWSSRLSAAVWKLYTVLAGLLTGEPSAVWNEFLPVEVAMLLDVRGCPTDIVSAVRYVGLVGDILRVCTGCWRALPRAGGVTGLFHAGFEGGVPIFTGVCGDARGATALSTAARASFVR